MILCSLNASISTFKLCVIFLLGCLFLLCYFVTLYYHFIIFVATLFFVIFVATLSRCQVVMLYCVSYFRLYYVNWILKHWSCLDIGRRIWDDYLFWCYTSHWSWVRLYFGWENENFLVQEIYEKLEWHTLT